LSFPKDSCWEEEMKQIYLSLIIVLMILLTTSSVASQANCNVQMCVDDKGLPSDTLQLSDDNRVILRFIAHSINDTSVGLPSGGIQLPGQLPGAILLQPQQFTGEGEIIISPRSPTDPRFDPLWEPGAFVLRSASANMSMIFETAHEDKPGHLAPVERVRIAGNGNVGIGTCPVDFQLSPDAIGPCPEPQAKLDVNGNIRSEALQVAGNVDIGTADTDGELHIVGPRIRLENGEKRLDFRTSGGSIDIESANHSMFIASYGDGDCPNNCNNVYINPYADNGDVGIGTTQPQAKLDVNGTTRTNILQITGGGADVAETFEIEQGALLEPGMVVVIDLAHPGRLTISDTAYDRKVAGVISGAGDLEPGLIIGSESHDDNNELPVALSGRVYCNVDATYGEVEPGDLLTTSPTPGYAMAVKDYDKAQGAILGKAMESLPEGETGQILVLMTLQ
jgi:hypothetical protein